MLYLQCGWPKTGTTSLQSVLDANRSRLAAAGFVYPEQWRWQWGSMDRGHNRIVELLKSSQRSGALLEEFKNFLVAHRDEDVLISFESFTLLVELEGQEMHLRFLAAAREVTPVTCIWTLRRFDEFRRSYFLQLISMGFRRVPTKFMRRVDGRELFSGMRQIENYVDDVAYVEYDPGGGHNAKLLRAFGMPAELIEPIEDELGDSPRLNPSLSHKQAVAILNLEALSVRAGVSLDQRTLLDAFSDGGFQFHDDQRCELVEDRLKRSLHARALRAAVECGFEPYVRFFAKEKVDDSSAGGASMDPEVLSDEDLNRLVAHLSVRT